MAAAMRPSTSILRQSCLSIASPARQAAFFSTRSPIATAATQLRKQNAPVSKSGVAAFHASSRRAILPPEPQVIQGTTNDPAPIPKHSPTHGSYHWTFERLVAASLVPLTVAPFAGGSLNPTMDAVLCGALVMHSHIGFQALIIDYLPPRRVPKTKTFCVWLLRAATLSVAVGLYEFETNDVGLTEGIKRIWKA